MHILKIQLMNSFVLITIILPVVAYG